MSGILVYALHYEGAFNKNSLGAVSEGARLASSSVPSATWSWSARASPTTCAPLGTYGASKVLRVEGPEGLAQPVVDAMAKVSTDNGHDYALFGGGLLGFEIGAGLTARLDAGVVHGGHRGRVEDGKLVAERPILRLADLRRPLQRGRRRDHRPPERVRGQGERPRRRRRSRTCRSTSHRTASRPRWSSAASSAAPT